MKNISYKKVISFILGAGMLGGCATSRSDNFARYVVTAKQDNKVVFHNVSGIPVQRVMTFDNTEMDYYRNINVGDTLGCERAFSDTQLVIGARDANIRLISRADILRMLELQQQTARRDSLINSMNQKQK